MCGITGIFGSKYKIRKEILNKMVFSLSHRGPDNNAIWIDENNLIGLGHTRLSIIDLTQAGNQPMHSRNRRYVIIYNGEIYNHLEIKSKIEQKHRTQDNYYWNGNSDTEILLESISSFGILETLKSLRGMFAFALWDCFKKELYLARDRMGEKPLYYGWIGNSFVFGSELKSIRQHPEFENEICRDSLSLYVRYNYIPNPYSIYKNLYKLQPGYFLKIDISSSNNPPIFENKYPQTKDQFILSCYWDIKSAILTSKKNLITDKSEAKILVENILREVIKMQSVADVPLGAFLSGGIDSSLIVALMQSESTSKINSFTIGFNEDEFNEANFSKKIANHLGTNHTEMYVESKDALDLIPELANIYDEPFADSSQIPTYLISKLSRKKVKVSLSGDGGDEIFGGYYRYIRGPLFWKLISPIPMNFRKKIAQTLRKISVEKYNSIENFLNLVLPSKYKQSFFGPRIHRLSNRLQYTNNKIDLYRSLVSEWDNPNSIVLNSNEPFHTLSSNLDLSFLQNFAEEMMYLDSITYLPDDILTKVDRASMAVSLESRAPFLDHKVVELSWQLDNKLKINNGISKVILRELLYKYVPASLVERPKQGFGIPLDKWLRGPLRDWAESLLDINSLKNEGYFNYTFIRNRWDEHLKGNFNWGHSLWSILMFQSWLKK